MSIVDRISKDFCIIQRLESILNQQSTISHLGLSGLHRNRTLKKVNEAKTMFGIHFETMAIIINTNCLQTQPIIHLSLHFSSMTAHVITVKPVTQLCMQSNLGAHHSTACAVS